jgi:hypothetical protein
VITGINGDVESDRLYHFLMQDKLKDLPSAYFKHLCGEYDTSSSFALWLASVVLKSQRVPGYVMMGDNKAVDLKRILIYNNLRGNNHALFLAEKC